MATRHRPAEATPPAPASPRRRRCAASLRARAEHLPLAEERRGEAAALPTSGGQGDSNLRPALSLKSLHASNQLAPETKPSSSRGPPPGPHPEKTLLPPFAVGLQPGPELRGLRPASAGPAGAALGPGEGGLHGGRRGRRWRPAARVSASR